MTTSPQDASPHNAVRALYAGGSFIAVAALILGALAILDGELNADIKLPLILIVGVGSLLLTLGTLAIVYKRLGMQDKRQALGLPEGSVRAVLALVLILLFFISTIFFATFLSVGEETRSLKGVSAEQLAQIPPGDIASQRLVTTTTTTPTTSTTVVTTTAAAGAPGFGRPAATTIAVAPVAVDVTAADVAAEVAAGQTFDIELYVPINSDSRDLAKQAVTAGATLVAAIAAFYFGASTVQQASVSSPHEPPRDPPPVIPDGTPPLAPAPVAAMPPADPGVPDAPAGTEAPATDEADAGESSPIDACDVDWSAVHDDSDLFLLQLGIEQERVIPIAPPDGIPPSVVAPMTPPKEA